MSGKYAEFNEMWDEEEGSGNSITPEEMAMIQARVKGGLLLNGMTPSDMREYCRLYAQLIAEDREIIDG